MTPKSSPGAPTLVNTSFRAQRVTGQQRYATEIASRLLRDPGFREITPRSAGSSLRDWLWVLVVLPLRTRARLLLSLTSRAPLTSPRQVLVIHDLFVLTHPEWFSRAYVITHAPLLRVQLTTARAIVTVSEQVADELRPMFPRSIVVAPNAPAEVFLESASGDAGRISAMGLTRDGYFLTVGSLDPRKNLRMLAAAYSALSDEERAAFPLVVVGGGADIYRDQAIEWPEGVVLLGYVSDDELRALYAGARSVVFPSLAEGFGLPLVEAAAAGTRSLVISDIPVFRWICGAGAHYFDPQDAATMTRALRDAGAEPVAVTIDLSRFDWDSSAETVRRLCADLSSREKSDA